MKNRILYIIIALVIFAFLPSCKGGKAKTTSSSAGDTLKLKYARQFSIIKYKDYTLATVRNPWDTSKILETYILLNKKHKSNSNLPKSIKGIKVILPLKKTVVYSSVHCSLISQLGAYKSIAGVCDLQYIKMPEIQESVKNGSISDLGNGLNPDVEKIINLNPDALLISPFQNSGVNTKISQLHIPIIQCADYMEVSPLARLEWIKFYGILFGKEKIANEIFSRVENEYNELKKMAMQTKNRPTVIGGVKSSSAWYIAGGQSIMGILYKEAGANYVFSDYKVTGSIPLSFETVYDKGSEADFWFIKYNQSQNKTYGELKSDYELYSHFKAFKTHNIYGCNTNYTAYYEESPYNPQKLLKDLIKIFHPELLPEYKTIYFKKLEE